MMNRMMTEFAIISVLPVERNRSEIHIHMRDQLETQGSSSVLTRCNGCIIDCRHIQGE